MATKTPDPHVTIEPLTDLSNAHARSLARYDALNAFRNATIIANAGFAKALELALTGQVSAAQSGLRAATVVLVAGIETWRAIDSDKPFDAKAIEALIDYVEQTVSVPA